MKSETGSLLEAVVFKEGGKDSGPEKRKEARYPAHDAVEIRILPEGHLLRATIIDVSRSGLRLELETALAKQSRIEVFTASKLTIVGEVRYCRKASGVFHAGVQIEEVVSAESSSSQHLPEDDLVLYVAGKGLTQAEIRRVEDHLSKCRSCSRLRAQTAKSLHPTTQKLQAR